MTKRPIDSSQPPVNPNGTPPSEAVPPPEPRPGFAPRRRRRRRSLRTRRPSMASASSPSQASRLSRRCIIGVSRSQRAPLPGPEPTVSSSEVAQAPAQASSASASRPFQAIRSTRSTDPRLVGIRRLQPVAEPFHVPLVPIRVSQLRRHRRVATRRPESAPVQALSPAQAASVPSSVQVPSQAPQLTRQRITRENRPHSSPIPELSPTGQARAEPVPSSAPRMRRPSTVIPRPPGPIFWEDLLRPVPTPPPDPTIRASVPEPPHWIVMRQRMARQQRAHRSRRSSASSREPTQVQIPAQGSELTNQCNIRARHPQTVSERIPSQVVDRLGSAVVAIPAEATRSTNQRIIRTRRLQSSARVPALSSQIQAQSEIFGPSPSLPLGLQPALPSTLQPALPPALPQVSSVRPIGRMQPSLEPENPPALVPVRGAPILGLIVLDVGTAMLEPALETRGRNATFRRSLARLVARAGHSSQALSDPNDNQDIRDILDGNFPFPRNSGNRPRQ